ncbi:MAG: NPCBM/NEW2 domain-containing protein [Lachnospiraceae bacterium]|nr:NPCBM/NEW2 domain-containing protein [Lachnospiraceae bacterium]
MKLFKRLMCVLLSSVMVLAAAVPAAVPAYAEAVTVPTISSTGSTAGKNSHAIASSVRLLSDLYNTDKKISEYVIGYQNDEDAPQTFFVNRNFPLRIKSMHGSDLDLVSLYNGSSSRLEIYTGSTASGCYTEGGITYRTVGDRTLSARDILLGYNASKYNNGISGLLSPSGKKPCSIIYDLQGLDADYFYSVVGLTSRGNDASNWNKNAWTMTCNVYGSTTGTDDADFTLLATSTGIKQWLTAEFDVCISGYRYLKLEAVATGTAVNTRNNYQFDGAFSWADACVYQTERTSFAVQTSWNDTGNESYRPDSIQLQLLADGVPSGAPVTVSSESGYGYSWPSVPKYNASGAEAVYSVTASIPNYRVSYENGILTCTFVLETEFSVTVDWNDSDDAYGVRPAQLALQLYADDAPYGDPVSVDAAAEWTYKWERLPARKEGASDPVSYSVKVTADPEYYTSAVDGDLVSMTSTYDPAVQTVSYASDILWVDEDESARPSEIRLQLFADGAASGDPVILNSENGWKYTWEGLAKHRNGTDPETVVYSAKVEELPANYAVVYSGKRIIICTFRSLIDYVLKVVWNDSDNAPGLRPVSLNAQLTSNGDAIGEPVTIDDSNEWSHTWSGLYASSTGSWRDAGDGDFRGAEEIKEGTQVTYLTDLAYLESSNSSGAPAAVNYPYGGKTTDKIIIGEENTVFEKGLGVHPEVPSNKGGEGWTIYDISALNADRFYAAAGITNANGKNGSSQGVIFRVFGDYGDGEYVLLSSSDTITGKKTGEFSVGISGVKKLKLAIYPAGTNNWSCGSIWADACVYTSTSICGPMANYSVDFEGLPEEYDVSVADGVTTLTYLPKAEREVSVIWNDNDDQYKHRPESVRVRAYEGDTPSDYVFRLNAADGWKATVSLPLYAAGTTTPVTYTLRQDPVPELYKESISGDAITNTFDPSTILAAYTPSENGDYKGASDIKSGSLTYLSYIDYTESSNTNGASTSRDCPYGSTAGALIIGKKDTSFSLGLGVHPESPTAQTPESWTTYDLSGMDVDRFYSAVGITNPNGKKGVSKGVIMRVYGEYGDGVYRLLGESRIITGKDSGEFLVDISGVKSLKLGIVAAGTDHYSSASAWANACVFKYEKGGESFSGSKVVLPGKYTASKSGNYTTTVKAVSGSVRFLSDLTYTEASNTTSKEYPNGKPTNLDHPYGEAGDIVIGTKAQKIKKGLGVHPKAASTSKPSFTTYDLTSLDVDRFYAVVGITNEKGKNGQCEPVYFRVYADYEGQGKYTLLAESDYISGKQTGEFDVDITGAKYLKLMVFASGAHTSCGSVWGNACVYKYSSKGSEKIHTNNSTLNYELNYKASKGNYTEDLKAAEGSVIFLSKTDFVKSANTTNDKYPKGQPTNYNHPYGSTAAIAKIGKNNQFFYTGLGMHPMNPNKPVNGSIESYTIYDLRGMDVNRFYSAIGLTNTKGKNGNSKGTIFRVYIDKKGNGSWQLIGQSDIITGFMSGEFDLDITGAKQLKVAVVSATKTHDSSAVFWANACVYKYDENGSVSIHKNHEGPATPPKAHPTDNYYPSKDGTYMGLPMEYDKWSVLLSALSYVDSSNTSNATYPMGQPTTVDHPYGKPEDIICIGEQEALFFDGLGMHPKNPVLPIDYSIESWTIYDVAELGANRFYSAIGITNSNGKAGKSQGVIYRVYVDYGDGTWVKVAESENITKKMSGEFIDVDITGAKLVKLAVICGGSAHDSSGCAWANASFYSTTGPLTLPSRETKPHDDKPAEPVTEAPTEAAEEPAEPSDGLSTGALIGIIAGAVAAVGAAVTIFIVGGKKKKEEE